MRKSIENLQHTLQLLALYERERPESPAKLWVQSARGDILSACLLLEQRSEVPESRVSAVELILKAELALASIAAPDTDLSFRVAEQLLLEARVRIEAAGA